METLRQESGLSGFLKRSESEYDVFGAGHAATSISAALGIAAGRDLLGDSYKVVAVLGDGALTSGLAYEGLNNAGHSGRDLVVILNDNAMSIAPNVGAISKYLTSVQRNPLYNRVRARIGDVLEGHPALNSLIRKWEGVKSFSWASSLRGTGLRYAGPVDATTSTTWSTPWPPCVA
jgi:1-deoxy-D-xylulose-5-phosphate synthase